MAFDSQKSFQDKDSQVSQQARPQPAAQVPEPLKFESGSKAKQELEPTKSHQKVWDFRLPRFGPECTLQTQNSHLGIVLVAMMQNGMSPEVVKDFLDQLPDIPPNAMDVSIKGFPIMFYATQTNNEKMIRLIASFSANLNIVSDDDRIPLLAYTIINSQIIQQDTSAAVVTLLSLGASAVVFPTAFYSPYDVELPVGGPPQKELTDLKDDHKKWCQYTSMRSKLAEALNITYRYYLDKSTKVPQPQLRETQVAGLKDVTPLLGIPYLIIGQTTAATTLRNSLLVHMARKKGPQNRKPLVLVFAGPSGHGKTELANKMSSLLSLETLVIDCPQFSSDTELFGPRPGYYDAHKGSQLNNFLAKHDNKKCIVFLDEFEKTSEEIHNTLLKPFDEGLYQDRRTTKDVDASQVIWILATNVADHVISSFTEENASGLFNDKNVRNQTRLVKELSGVIKDVFKAKFGASLTYPIIHVPC
ncbi:hypothetical protein FKW77_003081 [Venturia effusa]|uniref:AAA+ ATPase domain-containing protein n=1 Tax=Venturia effusa TaxID=50376 RepID=A0A517LID5_9PEZI|nr:hypothetical protein FKW77_003081 [Venturia effusa]